MLSREDARVSRRSQLTEPHIAPLAAFVAELRREAGREAAVPDFDPWDGGTRAEVLYLLEAPGAKAVRSGFISRNNPDETAKNLFEASAAAGIDRRRTAVWNIVPWYIGAGGRIRPAAQADIDAGLGPLQRLLEVLPNLRAIVLVGRKAERARPTLQARRPDLRIFCAPHPSPLFVNNAPGNRERLLAAFRDVAAFLGNADPTAAAV